MHLLFQSSNLSSFGFAAGRWLGFAWPGSGSARALPPAPRSAVPRFAQEKIWNSSACLALCSVLVLCLHRNCKPRHQRCWTRIPHWGSSEASLPLPAGTTASPGILLEDRSLLSKANHPGKAADICSESGKGPSLWCVSLFPPMKQ